MLALTRKLSESIIIGGNVVVTVVEVRGNRVKLGIDAPKEQRVVRSELVERDAEEPQPCANG